MSTPGRSSTRARPLRAKRSCGSTSTVVPVVRPDHSTSALRRRDARCHASPRVAASSGSTSPTSTAASSASTVDVVRSAGTWWACRSWRSWTVHSTSDTPPRPSLRCRDASTPRGSRSASTRALMRRTSRTCARSRPPAG
ncbi:Uncharacterised protein [Mycobacteroides abscessus]|nr:Uncharacterised protein [Mycobacteroides abscessus]